jgi:hypothetical protein
LKPTVIAEKEDLDRVLVACLRLFARRGREVRLQRQLALPQTATNDPVSASLKAARESSEQNFCMEGE